MAPATIKVHASVGSCEVDPEAPTPAPLCSDEAPVPVRAEIFASLRLNSGGPQTEAGVLRQALEEEGVLSHIIDAKPGGNITDKVFLTLERCELRRIFSHGD